MGWDDPMKGSGGGDPGGRGSSVVLLIQQAAIQGNRRLGNRSLIARRRFIRSTLWQMTHLRDSSLGWDWASLDGRSSVLNAGTDHALISVRKRDPTNLSPSKRKLSWLGRYDSTFTDTPENFHRIRDS